MKRRKFMNNAGLISAGLVTGMSFQNCNQKNKASKEEPAMGNELGAVNNRISLAQWSLVKEIRDNKTIDNLDFAAKAKALGCDGIEYVNQFFFDEAENIPYLSEMIAKAKEAEVEQLLIMVDDEGDLAAVNNADRLKSVDGHKRWVDAAKYLGCHSIRVNLFGEMYDLDAWVDYASHGLSKLVEYSAKENINVLVENHGWLSSNAAGLVRVMQNVNHDNCGTLPDFGNFCVRRPNGQKWGPGCDEEYDKYKGVDELMPFAKAVSAKAYAFDDKGNETTIDYPRMMGIVNKHGYKGFIGVEFEGEDTEPGIIATRKLITSLL